MIFSVGVQKFEPLQTINDFIITVGVQNFEPRQNIQNDTN
jgi:hypothetical protein